MPKKIMPRIACMEDTMINIKITPRNLISLTTGEKLYFKDGSTEILITMNDE